MNGPFDYQSIQQEESSIIVSGKVALARHIFVTHALNNGLPVDVRIGNLLTFQKQKGQWKLLGRQAYKL
jgi:ketosteroid isomerase-like protein